MLGIMGSKNVCAFEFACIIMRNIKCSFVNIIGLSPQFVLWRKCPDELEFVIIILFTTLDYKASILGNESLVS